MSRLRVALLVAVVLVGLGVSGGYFLLQRPAAANRADVPGTSAPSPAALDAVLAAPHIVFRDMTPGAGYSTLALTTLAAPADARIGLSSRCERVYATAQSGVCLRARRSVAPSYELVSLDDRLAPRATTPLPGPPSRARMSVDGSLVATTVFLTGHSYGQVGFSTETVIRQDGRSLGNLEGWTTTLPDGTRLTSADRNFWGVTFSQDDDTFFATAASGSTTWLVRGSVTTRTMTALRTDAECPSFSPDGRKVAYKKRLDAGPGVWRLAVLDLTTGAETLLADARSVDDQVEWLDDDRVLYAVPREGGGSGTSDVWVQPADGTGAPAVLIPGAASPGVVR